MLSRIGLLAVVAVAAFAMLGVSSGQAQTPEKFATLDPTSGPVGTVVTAELFNAPPNDAITVIFKIPGDPILATGTTDATGHATFTFTIPYVPGGGTWPVFFTNFKCSCQVSVDFTVVNVRPTNTPTATPTSPPLPSVTPTPTATQSLPTATATPTPGVPVLGTTSSMGGPGPNIGILALGAMAVITVLSWFGATRRGPRAGSPAVAFAHGHPSDEYSTDLDGATLDALLERPVPAATSQRRGHGVGWAIGAGLGAVAGVFLLRRK